jgi:hypothetical protein
MKRFHTTQGTPAEDFSLEQEKENGDLSESELVELDSIEVGASYKHPRWDYSYIRLPDADTLVSDDPFAEPDEQ